MKKLYDDLIDVEQDADDLTFTEFKAIVEDRDVSDTSYQLAGQLATTALAEEVGYLSEDMLIFAPSLSKYGEEPDKPLFGYMHPVGIVSLGELIYAAISELRRHPRARRGDPWWSYQNSLARVLRSINNDAILQVGW